MLDRGRCLFCNNCVHHPDESPDSCECTNSPKTEKKSAVNHILQVGDVDYFTRTLQSRQDIAIFVGMRYAACNRDYRQVKAARRASDTIKENAVLPLTKKRTATMPDSFAPSSSKTAESDIDDISESDSTNYEPQKRVKRDNQSNNVQMIEVVCFPQGSEGSVKQQVGAILVGIPVHQLEFMSPSDLLMTVEKEKPQWLPLLNHLGHQFKTNRILDVTPQTFQVLLKETLADTKRLTHFVVFKPVDTVSVISKQSLAQVKRGVSSNGFGDKEMDGVDFKNPPRIKMFDPCHAVDIRPVPYSHTLPLSELNQSTENGAGNRMSTSHSWMDRIVAPLGLLPSMSQRNVTESQVQINGPTPSFPAPSNHLVPIVTASLTIINLNGRTTELSARMLVRPTDTIRSLLLKKRFDFDEHVNCEFEGYVNDIELDLDEKFVTIFCFSNK
ncbi:hypothetical protein HDU79_005711 [Rhizoclosmatium sp. JEL0117]|nr:hypothetical protein HDU79_005711 [Rhizoclosmatium sp. JEL0117]